MVCKTTGVYKTTCVSLTHGLSTLKLSRPCFPLDPFSGLALTCSFILCLIRSWFSLCGANKPSLLLQPTLYRLLQDREQNLLERLNLCGRSTLPQNSQRRGIPPETSWLSGAGRKQKSKLGIVYISAVIKIL